jgi:hypothetical protein
LHERKIIVKKKNISINLWVVSILLMLFIGMYQKRTGPSYPIKKKETFGQTAVQYEFSRSSLTGTPQEVKILVNGPSDSAFLMSRLYKADEEWSEVEMKRSGNEFSSFIKDLPAAGKMEYIVKLVVGGKNYFLNGGKAAVIRFRGDVPAFFMIPHIFLMFLAILFGARTGMEAIRKEGNYNWMVVVTLIIVILGGFVFGPIIQKYAFGQLWTGFPFGYDLTDNKILLSIIFWLAAFFLKKKSKYWVFAAAILMIVIYLIPHSVLGSELDLKTGLIKTGL